MTMFSVNKLTKLGLVTAVAGTMLAAPLMASAEVQEMVSESQMGLAYGLLESVGGAAVMLSPLLAGLLYKRQPAAMYPVTLVLIGVVLMLSVVFVFWQRRQIGRTAKQPQTS